MATTLVIKGADFSANKIETVQIGDLVPCTGISLDHGTLSINTIGGISTLTPTLTPANTTDTLSWESNDNSVATVANGVVTAVSLGTATITAICGTQTATCVVTVDNVVTDYVAICGYAPYKRSDTSPTATTDKKTGTSETSAHFIIAKNQATGSYPIETKSDVDTSPYRLVPVKIPSGATKIKISTSLASFRTRVLWFNSEVQETIYNIGATCLGGLTSGYYDQESSTAGPVVIDIPTDLTGLDSFASAVSLGGGNTRTKWEDYAADIIVEFLIGAT